LQGTVFNKKCDQTPEAGDGKQAKRNLEAGKTGNRVLECRNSEKTQIRKRQFRKQESGIRQQDKFGNRN
jgi:hypothetical protein